MEGVLDVGLDLDRHVLLERARDASVVLDGDDDLRQADVGDVRCAVRRVAAEEDRAAVAAPGADQAEHAFILVELIALLGERRRAAASAAGTARAPRAAASAASTARRAVGLGRQGLQLLLGVALAGRRPQSGHVAHRRGEHPLAFELPLEPGEVLGRLDHRHRRVSRDEAVGAGRPRGRHADDREAAAGRRRLHVELVVRPAAAEWPVGGHPWFELHVGETPRRHFLHRPVARLAEAGRVGQPRTVDVGQPAHDGHDLRPCEALVVYLVERLVIDLLLRLLCGDGNQRQCRRQRDGGDGRSVPKRESHRNSSRIFLQRWQAAMIPQRAAYSSRVRPTDL